VSEVYRQDGTRVTPAELVRRRDQVTDAWVFHHLGSDDLTPDQWPRMSDGRLHGQVSLEAAGAAGEFGTHVDFLERPALPEPPEGELCSNCHLAPPRVRGLCERCRKAVERTGRLPTKRATWFHRRRGGHGA
jgi:hypothetical protein